MVLLTCFGHYGYEVPLKCSASSPRRFLLFKVCGKAVMCFGKRISGNIHREFAPFHSAQWFSLSALWSCTRCSGRRHTQ